MSAAACYYQAVLANGDIREPDAVKCDLIRFLTNLAIRLVVHLRQHHPDVLDALPSPYGIPPASATLPPEAPYQPTGRLVTTGAPQTIPLGGPGRIRAGLANTGGLSATLEIAGSRLTGVVELSGDPSLVQAMRIWIQPLSRDAFTMRDLAVRKPGDSGQLLKITPSAGAWLVTPEDRFRRVPYEPDQWRQAADVNVEWTTRQVRFSLALPKPASPGNLLGINLIADLHGGGWTALALHEPFLALQASDPGPLSIIGPDAPTTGQQETGLINGGTPRDLIPLGRWAGLQGNVC